MPGSRYRVKVHDRYQVEVKFEYPIAKDRPRESFRVDTYFFVPSSLGVHPNTYSQAEFYQDLQTHTRYGTPVIPMDQLLDETNEFSPFTRIAQLKESLRSGSGRQDASRRLEYDLRILGCIFRSEIREQGRLIRLHLAGSGSRPRNVQDAVYLCDKFLDSSVKVLTRLREWQREFLDPHVPSNVSKAFRYVDEAMSVQLEGGCGKVHESFSRVVQQAPQEASGAAHKLAAVMHREEKYRREAGYPTAVDTSNTADAERASEYHLFRIGVLKKYLQSTLFLSIQTGRGSRPILTTISAIAAMAGMGFFMFMLWALQVAAPANSFPYVLLVVIVYAFRESIKENFKGFLSKNMTGWLRDRESNLIDRGVPHRIVGRIAEAMTFVPSNRVPKQVRDKRAPDELVELAEEGAPEDVIQYQKSVKVYSDEIFKVHTRITCLDEIMRFSVRNFLLRMDEPKKGLTICESLDSEEWSPDGSEEQPTTCTVGLTPLQHVRAAKVYHVNMVLLVSMKDEHGKWISDVEKFRLVLSRDGIERVETGAYSDAVLVQGADAFSNPPTQLPTIENIAAEGQMPSSAVAPPL